MFFFKQKTAYEMRIRDWSSDVCSSDLELMRISNLSSMEVLVEVNENDITRISVGDTASIDVDAFLGEEFTGLVTEIASSANNIGSATDQIANIDQVTNFNVKVRILPESYQDLMKDRNIKDRKSTRL